MTAREFVETVARLDRGHSVLLARGQEFLSRIAVASNPITQAWAKRRKPRAKQCYMNSQRFVLDCDEASYFEGYWFTGDIPVWHAWVMLDGNLFDFTAEACERSLRRSKIEMAPLTEQSYFGVHIPTDFLRSHLLTVKVWGDVLSFYLTAEEEKNSLPKIVPTSV